MNPIRDLWRLACLYYYEALLGYIDPLDDQVPELVHRIQVLHDQLRPMLKGSAP